MILDIIQKLNIKENDIVLVSSDFTKILFNYCIKGIEYDLNIIIDALLDSIGKEGTLLIPTYNWDFCRGIPFDYNRTPSKTGALGNVALKRADFIRTRHPIYSFAVAGKDKDILYSIDNINAWCGNTPFNYLYQNNAKNIFIDVGFESSATFIHYVEEKCNVDYRYTKEFTGEYIDKEGRVCNKTYSMYVRNLDKNINVVFNKMEPIFMESGILYTEDVEGITFKTLYYKEACDLVENDIRNNNGENVCIVC